MIGFASHNVGWAVLAAVGFILYALWHESRRRRRLRCFASAPVLPELTRSFHPATARRKLVVLCLAAVLLLLAALRPQWGFEWEEVAHRGADVFVAVDVSRSMLTQDVLPSRLARTKLALQELVNVLRGDRIGLIAFSGSAFVQCPLTIDYGGFLMSVEQLSADLIPRGGTNIGAALRTAEQSFAAGSESPDKILIIITDGENHEGDPVAEAAALKEQGITVYTIGVGTPQGELIQLVDENGNKSYLKTAAGEVVKSSLNESLLQELALATGGAYLKATPAQFGLQKLYEQKIAGLEKTEFGSTMEKRYTERYQIPLSLALLLLFGEGLLSRRRKS